MHIGGAHLHNQLGQSSVSASSLASKHAGETRKKLFAAAEELDTAVTAESAWMIGAWAGGGENGSQHGGSDQQSQGRPGEGAQAEGLSAVGRSGTELSTHALSELSLEQGASAGAQAWTGTAAQPGPSTGYGAYTAGRRAERAGETRQVSYWA